MCVRAYMATTQYEISAGPEVSLNISLAYFQLILHSLISNQMSIIRYPLKCPALLFVSAIWFYY